jgi:hypothetical protein
MRGVEKFLRERSSPRRGVVRRSAMRLRNWCLASPHLFVYEPAPVSLCFSGWFATKGTLKHKTRLLIYVIIASKSSRNLSQVIFYNAHNFK